MTRDDACRAMILATLVVAGCDAEPDPADETAPGRLAVETRARGSIQVVGSDTLTGSAQIVALHPEPDGDAVAVIFADSIRNVSAGLAVEDQRSGAAHLLWPDSVSRVWWSAPHTLSFTTATGTGVRVVVDVHAAALETIERADSVPTLSTRSDSADQLLLGRAQQFVDSIRAQPTGLAQNGALAYTATTLLPDPTGTFAAFHVTARDSLGRTLNPAWYVMHLPSGEAVLIDEIVGEGRELPRAAAGWTDDARFVYAKGPALHEAVVRREPGAALGADTAAR